MSTQTLLEATASYVSRVSTALTNIRTAITNKGGTASSSTKLEGIAAAIATIPSGSTTTEIESILGVTKLYSNDAVSITYTSTTAGTAKSITGITGIATYPFVVVIIENSDADTASALKFRRSATVIGNNNYAAGSVSAARYGTQQYYNSSSVSTQTSSTSYGLWGYTISTSSSGTLTIRGRCNGSYYTSLTGTYKVTVLGIKF